MLCSLLVPPNTTATRVRAGAEVPPGGWLAVIGPTLPGAAGMPGSTRKTGAHDDAR